MTDTSQLLDLERVQQVAATLSARDTWPRAALLDVQAQRLESLLRHAVADSPYYRTTIGSAVAAGAPLEELPSLTKTTLMNEWDRINWSVRRRPATRRQADARCMNIQR